MTNPLVSVIIPTYNRAHTISCAIDSVLNQTYKNIELIIVDDASTDDTEEVVKYNIDKRIVYVRHDKNEGGSAARNTGIRLARGEYIAFLDSDDEWEMDKLTRQIEVARTVGHSYGCIYTGFLLVDADKIIIKNFSSGKSGCLFPAILLGNVIGAVCSILIRSDTIKQIDGFDIQFPSCQDWDLYIRLSKITSFFFIAEPLVKVHLDGHSGRISLNSKAVMKGHEMIKDKFAQEYKLLSASDYRKAEVYYAKKALEIGEYRYGYKILFSLLKNNFYPSLIATVIKCIVISFINKLNFRKVYYY